jgi:hypothetical protein
MGSANAINAREENGNKEREGKMIAESKPVRPSLPAWTRHGN